MRRLDRLLALVIGLVVAAIAVLAGIEIVELAAGRAALLIPRHTWDTDLRRQHWVSYDIGVTAIVLIAVGAVLVLLQLLPRRAVRLAVKGHPGERLFVSRKGLARRLAHDLQGVEVVGSAKVKVGRRRVRAKVALVPHTDPGVGQDASRSALGATLHQIAMVREPKVAVRAKVKVPAAERRPPRPPAGEDPT